MNCEVLLFADEMLVGESEEQLQKERVTVTETYESDTVHKRRNLMVKASKIIVSERN